ncbi:MAG: discoidin domain-containing protein, partial [bacterium]
GIMVYIFSSFLYLFFGASRLTALSTNFVFFPVYQLTLFAVIRKISNSWSIATACVGLSLAIAIPFGGDTINPTLSIAAYQRDLIGFNLFGIFLTTVFLSDTFRKWEWSILAGIVAGFTVTFRYNMVFHFVGIYLTILFFLFLLFVLVKRKKGDTSLYKTRFFYTLISMFSMSSILFYPVYLARSALYNHYFVGKVVGPKDKNFLELYGGFGGLYEKLRYYPFHIYYTGMGHYFHFTTLLVLGALAVFILCSIYLRYVRAVVQQDNDSSSQVKDDGIVFNNVLFYGFLGIAFLVPLFILNVYPARAWNAALFLTSPALFFVYIIIARLYSKFAIPGIRSLSIIGGLIAVVAVSSGMYFQVKNFSRMTNSTHYRSSYQEAAKLYDDVFRLSKEYGLKQPKVSINFLENYTLGSGVAMTAYQYEKTGELFSVIPKLGGNDISKKISREDALELLSQSDLAVFSLDRENKINTSPVNCDPLSDTLAKYPFVVSMESFQEDLFALLKSNFIKKGSYKICGRTIGLYVHHKILIKPIEIKASSIMNEQYSAATVMDNIPNVWHSIANPEYPQWIKFKYTSPVVINSITVKCQPGGSRRAPLEFQFQGRNTGEDWGTLLEVENAGFSDSAEVMTWPVINENAFTEYRLFITKNNGAPDFVTVGGVSFDYTINDEL